MTAAWEFCLSMLLEIRVACVVRASTFALRPGSKGFVCHASLCCCGQVGSGDGAGIAAPDPMEFNDASKTLLLGKIAHYPIC